LSGRRAWGRAMTFSHLRQNGRTCRAMTAVRSPGDTPDIALRLYGNAITFRVFLETHVNIGPAIASWHLLQLRSDARATS
jgi:hypothetical protein